MEWAPIRNVSHGRVHLVEKEAEEEYSFDVLDASGKAVPLTARGKVKSELTAHPDPHRPYMGFISTIDLAPYEEIAYKFDFSAAYEVRPGQAYKIRIKRTQGLPTADESRKAVKQVEVSCSVEIPDFAILR